MMGLSLLNIFTITYNIDTTRKKKKKHPLSSSRRLGFTSSWSSQTMFSIHILPEPTPPPPPLQFMGSCWRSFSLSNSSSHLRQSAAVANYKWLSWVIQASTGAQYTFHDEYTTDFVPSGIWGFREKNCYCGSKREKAVTT